MEHTQVRVVPMVDEEIDYVLDLVRNDVRRRQNEMERARIPQRRMELKSEIDEIEALKERLGMFMHA